MALALIPKNLYNHPMHPDAYGIRCAADGKWEAVLCGEVIARRNTAADAAAVIMGLDQADPIPPAPLDGITINDMIGAPAFDPQEYHIPNLRTLLAMAAVSAAVILGVGWLALAVISYFER